MLSKSHQPCSYSNPHFDLGRDSQPRVSLRFPRLRGGGLFLDPTCSVHVEPCDVPGLISGSPFCLLPPHLWHSWLLSTQALGSAGTAASHLQAAPGPQDWSLCSPCIVPCLRTLMAGLGASAEGREPAIFWALQANTMGTTSWSPLHVHQTYNANFDHSVEW